MSQEKSVRDISQPDEDKQAFDWPVDKLCDGPWIADIHAFPSEETWVHEETGLTLRMTRQCNYSINGYVDWDLSQSIDFLPFRTKIGQALTDLCEDKLIMSHLVRDSAGFSTSSGHDATYPRTRHWKKELEAIDKASASATTKAWVKKETKQIACKIWLSGEVRLLLEQWALRILQIVQAKSESEVLTESMAKMDMS